MDSQLSDCTLTRKPLRITLRLHLALILGLLWASTSLFAVPATTVLKGTIIMDDGAGKTVELSAGQTILPGRSVKPASPEGATLSPIPMVEVTMPDKTSIEIQVGTHDDNAVKVITGALSYTTKPGFTGDFVIQTAGGAVSVKGGSGGSLIVTGTSVRVAASSGQTTFSAPGRDPITVAAGNVLGVSGSTVTITDVVNKTVAVLAPNNSVQSIRPATTSDLQLAVAAQTTTTTSPTTTPLTSGTVNPVNVTGNVNSPAE